MSSIASNGQGQAGFVRSRLAHRASVSALAVTLLASVSLASVPAWAENQMGYQLLSQQVASGLPHNRGSLGMDIERAQQITDDGLTFDIIRVKGVRRGSPGAQAGFSPGDQIVAVDGRVFANLAAFAAYVGSIPPGRAISVDYIPANGGPAQAQRIAVTVGSAGGGAATPATTSGGLSTGTKVAIGVGAAALFGCYELGCFSHKQAAPTAGRGSSMGQQPGTSQQQGGYLRQ